jgi:hypothetical protein
MTFFDTFSKKFAQYKRENKKILKGLKTEAQAKQFLSSQGNELKKDLEKAVKDKEKINFAGLPNAAKTFFGPQFVPKFKRKLKWLNAELIRLSGGVFKFNEGNAIFEFLENILNGSSSGFFANFITDGNEEERKTAVEMAIEKTRDFNNIDDVFEHLNSITNRENSNANWEAWGLFADDDQYKVFLNFPNS